MEHNQQERIRRQFDAFCRKVLIGEAMDCLREYSKRSQCEALFSELAADELSRLLTTDEYPSELHHFKVMDYDIAIKSDVLAEALETLSFKSRDIILMHYFLDMSDEDIGKLSGVYRTTVHYHRKNALERIRAYITEVLNNEGY